MTGAITDLNGVGPVMAQRLDDAGLGSVEAIAAATITELTQVPGVGPYHAARLNAEARALSGDGSAASGIPSDDKSKRTAKVAKSVKRLSRAIPDLAKSKKQAKRLKASTKRMNRWANDLDRRPVRKKFIAEVTKVGDDARKRTGSKKDARTLRRHTSKIERAVRKTS